MQQDQSRSRRGFLASAATGAGALALGASTGPAIAADSKEFGAAGTAFRTHEALKPLSFDPSKLTGLSEKMLRSHWENNYGGSVKALAAVKKRLVAALDDKDLPPYLYNDLKREHLIRTGSVVLHEIYFDNLGGSGKAGAPERQAIARAFGSFDAWENEFRRIGAGLGGGSGWVVLGFNRHIGQLENYWMADHATAPADTTPVVVMDMYEHSYQMDYGAAAARYIDAFFQNIQWDVVAARMASLPQAAT